MPTQEEIARGLKQPKRRGTVNNERRLDRFKKTVTERGEADWGDALPAHIAAVVVAATKVGGAVTFGLSRDGGAYMLTLLLDGERETLWFNGDADLAEELYMVSEALKQMSDGI